MRKAIILLLALVASPAVADSISGPFSARVTRVIDGDTFRAEVGIWPDLVAQVAIRIDGLDTPELRGRCPDEKARAVKARDALVGLLVGQVQIHDVRRGKFAGRVVARVTADGRDVTEAMIAAGHGRAYTRGRRRGWCAE